MLYEVITISIVDEFLPADRLIVYTEGKSRPKAEYKSTHRASCTNIEILVIIDEWSASASESYNFV